MDFTALDVEIGECHGVGRPWNNAEAYAVFNLKMDPETVRKLTGNGYNTMAMFAEYKADGEKVSVWERIEEEEKTKEKEKEVIAQDQAKAEHDLADLRAFLKAKGVKSTHLYGYDKALELALAEGYTK